MSRICSNDKSGQLGSGKSPTASKMSYAPSEGFGSNPRHRQFSRLGSHLVPGVVFAFGPGTVDRPGNGRRPVAVG
jgi:hypothetical protein